MIRKNHLLTMGIIASVLLLTAIDQGWAQRSQRAGGGTGRGSRHAPFWSELSDSRKTELHEMIQTMRDEGAGPAAVRDSVHARFDAWGIEVPDFQGPRCAGIADKLTEAQRTELGAMRHAMRDAGNSRKEIRKAVCAKLKEWNIEPPAPRLSRLCGAHPAFHSAHPGGKRSMHRPHHARRGLLSGYLKEAGDVTVSINSPEGDLVRQFDAGYQQAGPVTVQWDGRNNQGKAVPAGMYPYKIQAGEDTIEGRILMVR